MAATCKFELFHTSLQPPKRIAEVSTAATQGPSKLPRATDISVDSTPRAVSRPSAASLPLLSDVEVCVYRYTCEAGDIWSQFHDKPGVPLFQLQIVHDCQRSITRYMRNTFGDFLAKQDAESIVPKSLAGLEEAAGVKLVVADRPDSEDTGFVHWRVVFYSSDASNLMLLLDDWFQDRLSQLSPANPVKIKVHMHWGVDLTGIKDMLVYDHYEFEEPAATLPHGIFEAQPVNGKKRVTLNLQFTGEDSVDLVITGNTWPFKDRMDEFGIRGGWQADGQSDKRQYYRVRQGISADEAHADEFVDMIQKVFRHLALHVVIDGNVSEGTPAAAFVTRLKSVPNLFFGTIRGK